MWMPAVLAIELLVVRTDRESAVGAGGAGTTQSRDVNNHPQPQTRPRPCFPCLCLCVSVKLIRHSPVIDSPGDRFLLSLLLQYVQRLRSTSVIGVHVGAALPSRLSPCFAAAMARQEGQGPVRAAMARVQGHAGEGLLGS